MLRTRVAAVAAIPAIAAIALTGCVPSGSVRPAEVAAPREEVECLLGSWTLDLVDYASQAEPALIEMGIPVAGLTYTGTYRIEFTDSSDELLFTLASEVTGSATVNGVPVTGYESTIVNANFAWTDDEHDAVVIDNASPVGPVVVEGALPPLDLFGPEVAGEVAIACSGDTLSLSGPGAPFVGLFVRQ